MDYQKFDDETLLRLIQRGHEKALSELYDRFGRLVFSIAYHSTGDQEGAEEITQDVFIRVWEKASTYRVEQGRVATWLTSIARNRAIDILRHKMVRPESRSIAWEEFTFFDPADEQDVEGEIELSQLQQRMRRAVRQLPDEQRQALALAYFKGLSHQEIAATLDEPLGTVKTRIRLGMQKLRQMLESEID